jgi:hypothetical protein
MQGQQSWTSYAVTFGVLAVVLALRWRRMSRPRPLKLERLWIFPAFYLAVTVAMFVAHPPSLAGWLFAFAALAAGAALGWQRGKLMRIEIDPETHALNQRGSPAALLLILFIVIARTGARQLAVSGGLHVDPLAVTDVLIAFALGLFAATRLEMYLRARRLLDRAQSIGTA